MFRLTGASDARYWTVAGGEQNPCCSLGSEAEDPNQCQIKCMNASVPVTDAKPEGHLSGNVFAVRQPRRQTPTNPRPRPNPYGEPGGGQSRRVGSSIILRCLFLTRSRVRSRESEDEEPTNPTEEPSTRVRKNTKRKRCVMLRTKSPFPC